MILTSLHHLNEERSFITVFTKQHLTSSFSDVSLEAEPKNQKLVTKHAVEMWKMDSSQNYSIKALQ